MSSSLPHDSSDPLDELVFNYLERAESDPSSAAAVLDELCASQPEHATELRRRVRALVERGLWRPAAGDEGPREIGDFRILESLGQGGMGVVFLAEQKSVGRRVALKLVRAEQLLAGNARARFLREAHAIARLDHPGIVRVLTAGEHGGLPYLAMEYVEGGSLDALVRGLGSRDPAQLRGSDARDALLERMGARAAELVWSPEFLARGWTELVVRLVQSLAEAVQHAHERGVLHRDLKPSNVLLLPDGRCKLCDFGLASLADSARLTGSGAQLGTLAYMAPEQLRGGAVNAATDVYALGLVLYELLALRHPFLAPGEAAVRAALEDRAAPALRSLNRGVPVDIEVVCTKALERDPARRYASAGELARDLGHVLALRPIEARPPTLVRRAVRWTQRHPARAVGLALGALLALAGPVGWELSRARSMDEVERALERSENDFRAALSAIGHVLRDTATEELEDVPRMQQARLVALDRALELFARLAQSRPQDLAVAEEGSELHAARAVVLGDLGRADEAIDEGSFAVEYARRAAELAPSPERARRLAATLLSHGKSFSAVARTADGLALVEDAVERYRGLERPASDAALAKALIVLAESHSLLGHRELSQAAASEALEQAERGAALAPQSAELAWCAGRALGWLAVAAHGPSRTAERFGLTERSHAAFARAAELAPGERYYAYEVVEAEHDLGVASFESGDFERGEVHLRAALARLDTLLRDFPESRRYQRRRSQTLEQLGLQLLQRGRPDEARELLARVADERARELESATGRCDVRMFAALAHANLANAEQASGAPLERVLELNSRAEVMLSGCIADVAGNTEPERLVCSVRYSSALALTTAGELGPALAAIALHAETVGEHADRRRYAADLWNEYALALRRVEAPSPQRDAREAEAVERMFRLLDEAVRGGYHERGELESTPALEPFRSDPRFVDLLTRIPG